MSKYTGFRITSIHAFVTIGPDDEEGICGFLDQSTNTWMPMVAADIVRLEGLHPIAKDIAKATGQTLHLVKFSVREEVEEIKP